MGTFRRSRLAPGIYDEIISSAVDAQLQTLKPEAFAIERKSLEKSADVTAPLAALLREAVDITLDEVGADSPKTLSLAEDVLATLARHAPKAFEDGELQLRPERLLGIAPTPSAVPAPPRRSLHTSQLIVNAEGESLLEHLRSEFESADRVDLL